MFRVSLTGLMTAAALAVTAVSPALAGSASTTRIEPRPFYGATVSIEAGVRVFRPLPPTRHMIINPGHRTPLNLTIKDVTEKRYIESHNTYTGGTGPAPEGYAGGAYLGGPAYYGGAGYGRHGHHGRGGHGVGRTQYRRSSHHRGHRKRHH